MKRHKQLWMWRYMKQSISYISYEESVFLFVCLHLFVYMRFFFMYYICNMALSVTFDLGLSLKLQKSNHNNGLIIKMS